MTFDEAVAAISALEGRGWRLGLDRMREFLRRAGLAERAGAVPPPRFLHVAGTNGKGSTTAFVHALLKAQGHRVGAFFSPYVMSVRERVQGDGLISREDFARLTAELLPIAKGMDGSEWQGPTEFEFKTALGFAHWASIGAEWVALEVGLGGRLDATNVVSPAACGIVSIGLDHCAILGYTLEEIAAEKAGIIKPGVPVVVGRLADGPLGVTERIAAERDAPCWRLDHEVRVTERWDDTGALVVDVTTPGGSYPDLRPGLQGAPQANNLAVAVAMLEAGSAIRDPAHIAEGAAMAYAPGRFEVVQRGGVEWILDGAHNPDSARVLGRSLRQRLGTEHPLSVVSSMIQGHDLSQFYQDLRPWLGPVQVPPIDFYRARPPVEVATALADLGIPAEPADSVRDAMNAAQEDAERRGVPVLVTGSFYLVGAVGRELGLGDD